MIAYQAKPVQSEDGSWDTVTTKIKAPSRGLRRWLRRRQTLHQNSYPIDVRARSGRLVAESHCPCGRGFDVHDFRSTPVCHDNDAIGIGIYVSDGPLRHGFQRRALTRICGNAPPPRMTTDDWD